MTVDLEKLRDDGDTVAMDDGRTLRLRIKQDDTPVLWADGKGSLTTDADCYGSFAWVDDRAHLRDYGHRAPRPDGFDGNAEILRAERCDPIWWQPASDGPRRGTPEFLAERRLVLDLLTFGYTSVGIEVLSGTDAYGRPIVVDVASLGGIEWGCDWAQREAYLREIVTELCAELGIDGAYMDHQED